MKELELLNTHGFAKIEKYLTDSDCSSLIHDYTNDDLYRNTIDMKRYRFGDGQYRYFNYPLPGLIQKIRTELYTPLASLANEWNRQLGIDFIYPFDYSEFIDICRRHHQLRPTPLILRYEAGGYNTLHQDLYGDVYFPFQVVFMLTQQGKDFEGGEFIITEQVPRAQSVAQVVHANKGDAVVFTTNFRPVKGTRGYYRARLKHGISKVLWGRRYAMGVIFHDGK